MLAAAVIAATLVLDGGDLEQLPEPTRYTVCADGQGHLAFCGTREPLCYDEKHHVLSSCAHVASESGHGMPFRVALITAGNAFDLLATGIARSHGAHEANPALAGDPHDPSTGVEIRVGAKALGSLLEIGLVEFMARVLHKPRAANWMAGGFCALTVGAGAYNLAITW
jgi:hypothetical protein